MSNRAWVTLATNDSYGLGALVLAHSLRRVGSAAPAVVLITPAVTEAMRARLGEVFAEVITVDVLDSGDAAHLALLQRPELGITFTKLHCWNLTQYEKCVFLDADTLIVQNCDELFDREELSAAPDVGWPDCFNSGVFVYKPSAETFSNLIKFAQERGSFDGGDQGLLNLYFSDWARGDINKHLPFLYNVTSAAFYSYLPALKQYGRDLKIIHFIGATKPWLQHYNWRTGTVDAPDHLREFLQLWWNLFVAEVHAKLDTSMPTQQDSTEVEVEAPPPAIPQREPEYGEEVLNTGYYEATLNPQSEFPWHHPDNQIQNTESEPIIDMTEFHDPWNIYRGHIPPITDDNQEQPKEDYHEVRKHAWEYMPPVYEGNQKDYTLSQIESPCAEAQQSQDTHYIHEEYTSPQSETHHTDDYRQESHQTDPTSQHNFHEQSHTEYSHHSDYYEPKTFTNYSYEHNTEPPSQYTQNQSSYKQISESNSGNLNTISEHTSHYNNIIETIKSKHAIFSIPQGIIQNRTPYVYSVHLDHCVTNGNDAAPKVNGFVSDGEYETYEETPRHPYDGYYLRHQNTIDSRGRKVCSHQVPHLSHSPSLSPTPPDSPEVFEDAFTFPEEINEINGENHTGVASHLARIGQDLQSEAVDELVRRQGWEAGNIDYMGADSFANIWAKISHTLSKAPSPPRKQQSPPAMPPPAVPQSSIGGKDSIPLKETPPVSAEADLKCPPLEEPLPVSVETDTKQLTPEESLPAPVTTDTKELVEEEPLSQSLETYAKKALVDELTPVSIESSQEENPASTPIEAETKVLPLETLPVPVETDTKQLAPGDSLPAPIADTKVLPSEASPVTIEADSKELSSEASPVPTETDTKVLPIEASPVPNEAATKELPTVTSPAPIEAATKELPAEDKPMPIQAVTQEQSLEALPLPVETATAEPSETLSIQTGPDTKGQPLEFPPSQTVQSDTKEVPLEKPVPEPVKPDASPSEEKTELESDVPVSALGALKLDDRKSAASDSPPLATTPSKEDATAVSAAKSEERRKPVGKLQLHPPSAADPLLTPDSELEDADTLAQSIIASELRTPTVTSPSPTTEPPPVLAQAQPSNLGVEGPEVPTPPVDAVSLTQIGIKAKSKPTIAAQIESSVLTKTESTPMGSAPSTPDTDAPKKKLVKKVVKKEKEGGSGEAPVPPPRKKEKKPKDK